MVESWTTGSNDWIIGNDRDVGNARKRSLADPKSYGVHITDSDCNTAIGQPNTISGEYYYNGSCDNGGVHVNSGIQNYFFYLLAQGGSGTNEQGYSYSVAPIGMTKAANIAYTALTSYIISGTNWTTTRNAWLDAAEEEYGLSSTEWNSVKEGWCAVGFSDCEVECSVPTNPQSSSITQTTAELTFNSVDNSTGYELRIKESGGNWQYSNLSSTGATITGMECETTYYWEVRTICGNDESQWILTQSFTTASCGGTTCNAPNSLQESSVSQTTAQLSWNSVADAESYEIKYRIIGGNWQYTTSNSNTKSISALSCGSSYQWRSRVCAAQIVVVGLQNLFLHKGVLLVMVTIVQVQFL